MSETAQNNDNRKISKYGNLFDQDTIKNIIQVVLVPIMMLAVAFVASPDLKEIENFKAEPLFFPGLVLLFISAMFLFLFQLEKKDGWIKFALNELYVFSYSLVVTISISIFWVESAYSMLAAAVILVLFAILIRFPVEETTIGKWLDNKWNIKKEYIYFLLILTFSVVVIFLAFLI